MTRSKIAIKSSIISLVAQILSIVFTFIIRTCFINFLGVEVLGIDSVMKDLVSMLSLAELGVTTAITFRLYGAITSRDENRINSLMTIFKQVYQIIACVVLVLGLFISLFLNKLINGINLSHIYIYSGFYLQLTVTVSTYLLAYKRTLLQADQRQYICSTIDAICNTIFSLFKIVLLVYLKNYFVFLLISIAQTIISNLIVYGYCKKHYSFLNNKTLIDKELRSVLINDTKNVFLGRLAGYVYSSTDNVIISIFINTISAGLLSNYKYIITAMNSITGSILSPIRFLLGNFLNDIKDHNRTFKVLQEYEHIRFILAEVTVVPCINLTQMFISLWVGNEYVLSSTIVMFLSIDFYISCLYGPLGEYIQSLGMFKFEKYATGLGATTNLTCSIIGAKVAGIEGVLFGTILSQTVLWITKFYIVFKYYFLDEHHFKMAYIYRHIKYILFTIIDGAICYMILNVKHSSTTFYNFLFNVILCESITITLYLIVFSKTQEFKNIIKLFKRVRNDRYND